jgi:pyridoxamine 5'-phosphate oxidase
LRYEDFRREYTAGGLSRDMLEAQPLAQFETWLTQAVASELVDPTAMVLATVDARGLPAQRIVLFKGLKDGGFTFFTNYRSNKGRAIDSRPGVSLLFPWNPIDRQVIVRGRAERLDRDDSAAYFASRPWESQVAAFASRQSEPVDDRAALERAADAVRERYGAGEIPLPDDWGGYRVVPERMEFWQGGAHRLHDRFVYTLIDTGNWSIERLQP